MDFTPFLVGFVIMSLGSLAIYVRGSKAPAIRHHTYFHAAVPFIAATSYLAMAFGYGDILKPDGTITVVSRYIDWTFTTPILLAGLVLVALHERRGSAGFLVSIITLDVVMIVAGLIASLSSFPMLKLIWFVWSCTAFLGVLYVLWVPLRSISGREGGAMDGAYNKNLVFLSVIWLLYPVVFAVGPEGIKSISSNASIWAILVLDVIAKIIYGFYSASNIEAAAVVAERVVEPVSYRA